MNEPEDIPAGGWTDREIATFGRRVSAFTKEGLDAMESERLAEQMLNRDRPVSGDDRRVCFECKGLKGRVCQHAARMGLRAGFEPLRFILQRCDAFAMRGK